MEVQSEAWHHPPHLECLQSSPHVVELGSFAEVWQRSSRDSELRVLGGRPEGRILEERPESSSWRQPYVAVLAVPQLLLPVFVFQLLSC